PRPRRRRRWLSRRGDAERRTQGRRRRGGLAPHVPARSRGRAAALRFCRAGRARAVRPAPVRQRRRPEGRARGRLALSCRRASARDRARGRDALPGDPGHRQEDGRAHRARVEGEARRRRARGRGRTDRRRAHGRARRARRARVVDRRSRAGARADRSRRARGGACPPSVEEGRMTEVMAPVVALEDEELEQTLRPRRMTEFVGQQRVKDQLAIALEAATARDEALDHMLLVGPPGLCKTSLTDISRKVVLVGITSAAWAALERKGDIAAILTGLERHDVLFIDEIHRLNRSIEEILYPALEDFRLDIVVGQGPAARTLTLDLPQFTLVGATTRTGLLTTPL